MNDDSVPKFWEVNFFQLTLAGWLVMLVALLAAVLAGALVVAVSFVLSVMLGLRHLGGKGAFGILILAIAATCGAGQGVYRFGWKSFRKRGKRLLRDEA